MTWYVALLAGLALLMLLEHVSKLLNDRYKRTRLKRWVREYQTDYMDSEGVCLLCGEPEPHVCKARV